MKTQEHWKDKGMAKLKKTGDVKIVISRIMKNKNTWQRKYKAWEWVSPIQTIGNHQNSFRNTKLLKAVREN